MPLENSGYAFLFFYGLERRFLVEQQNHTAIVEQVVRLLDTYPSFRLFDAYLNLFLAYTVAKIGIESMTERTFDSIFEKTRLKWDENILPLLNWDAKLNGGRISLVLQEENSAAFILGYPSRTQRSSFSE